MVIHRPPAVRASHLQDDLRSLGSLGSPTDARVLARLRPGLVAQVEQAQSTQFLPIALNVEMAEAVFAEAGEAGVRRWGTASLVASLDGFFKPLLLGLTRLVAPSPALLFKTMPQGWSTTYQGCGELSVTELSKGLTRLTGRGLPPALASRAFLLAVCGTLEAAFAISRYQGSVTLEDEGLAPGEARWLSRWQPR